MSQHIIILAAGQSKRMGAEHKLLLPLGGMAMVRHVVTMACDVAASPIVVTGYQAAEVEGVLSGLDCTFIHNADYAQGMSSSLRAAISALPTSASSALILLGDMPLITAKDCNRLLAIAADHPDCVIRASHQGDVGNPVVLPSALFGPMAGLRGDVGAQALIRDLGLQTILVDIGAAALMDADTPEAYEMLLKRF